MALELCPFGTLNLDNIQTTIECGHPDLKCFIGKDILEALSYRFPYSLITFTFYLDGSNFPSHRL